MIHWQDMAMFDFNMEEMTLRPHCEDTPRKLECRLLEPNQESEEGPLSPAEIKDLLRPGQGLNADAEDEEEEPDHQAEEDDPAIVEAENIVPERPQDADDGQIREDDDAEELLNGGFDLLDKSDLIDKSAMDPPADLGPPCVPEGLALGEDPTLFEDGWFSDDEVLVCDPAIRSHRPPDPDAVFSKTASGSRSGPAAAEEDKTHGMNITPAEIRQSIPLGAKIQHRRSKNPDRASGWQSWPAGMPSRFFSYGGIAGRYMTCDEAMRAAVEYCWSN